ncbi:S9 family peptidase [Anseongella ginsenosidimutans]|uniref:S9 family peptidase n=1 Tax=Anseongella ginsenosidimutans TaxID=496056 RepID=UPI00104A30EB|nr:S9 family peptidase [Anseongella ginsenosidimutans]QEC51280.1 S9 family peptidase [Anseongella ginsenosidimutans]
MKRIRRKSILLLLVAVTSACTNEYKREKVALEDFFRNPEKTEFSVSPGGEFISYLQPYNNRLNIYVRELGSNEVTQVTTYEQDNIKYYWWANDEQLLYIKDSNGNEDYHLYSVNRDGTGNRDLTPFKGTQVMVHDTPADSIIIVGLNKRDPKVFDIYRLNINSGEMEVILENPGNVIWWMPDHRNKVRLVKSSDGVNETLLYRPTEDSPFKEVLTTNVFESIEPVYFSAEDPNLVIAISNVGRDKEAVVELDLTSGKEDKIIFQHDEVDVRSIRYSKKQEKPLFVNYITWKEETHFLDENIKSIYEKIADRLPELEIDIVNWNRNEDKFIVRTYSDRSPGSYYLYEAAGDDLRKLSEVSPWIDPRDMAEMKPVSYKTGDGLTIHGYLTLPKGSEGVNLPVIINPHGGPWTRNTWGFDPEVQFLANRGYAVLQMNYRGSTGYGKAFMKASNKEWGNKVQQDITDGVEWLIAEGVADPARIAICGFSFGGYCALSGVVQHPGLYRCAVSYSGMTNLFTFLKDIPPYLEPIQQMIFNAVGHPEKDADYLRAVSPIFHTAEIKVPLLVAQGEKDPRVNVNETTQFVQKLRENGLEVNYILKKDEGHRFRKEENRLHFYAELEEFLAKNLLN